MPTAIQRRRGTTSEHAVFTGLAGELTIDTTKNTAVVHNGATAGGFPLTSSPTLAAAGGAALVGNTPAGSIVASTVQAALNELDSEKVAIGGALGTPASGVVTNLTGTASININGTVGATTPSAVVATTVVANIAGSSIAVEAVIAPTLINSWVNLGGGVAAAGYYKDALGIVHVQGTLQTGASASVCFVLPSGYRPAANVYFACNANGAFGYALVTSGGEIYLVRAANLNIALDTISFRV